MSDPVLTHVPKCNLLDMSELLVKTPKDGAIVELGVYKGGSAYFFSKVAEGRAILLFDTFTGIPFRDAGDVFSVGDFGDTSAEAVQELIPEAKIYKGVFPRTMPEDMPGISFAHIDCDQGQSCRDAIKYFWPHVMRGGVMAFDDYNFEVIKSAIHDAFPVVEFTKNNVPYVVKT